MTFKQKVAELFPLARSASLLCFAIMAVSYNNDHDDVIGVCMLVFGMTSIVAIILTPTVKGPPS